MLPSASDLEYFLEVANTRNISRAAERLGISQPSLSLSIRRLEENVGVPLLIRNKQGVELTKGAHKLVSRARVLLEEWQRIRGEAIEAEVALGGRFVVGCHPSVALYSLPNVLPRLLAKHPSLELSLVHDLSRKVTEDVISFKVDFGVVVNPVRHPDLVIRELGTDEVTLWSSAAVSPDASRILLCDPDLAQSQFILKELPKKNLRFDRVVTSGNLEVIAALVATGAGVGILPARVAKRDKSKRLKIHSKDAPRFKDQICLVYRADAQRSESAKRILDAIASGFDKSV